MVRSRTETIEVQCKKQEGCGVVKGGGGKKFRPPGAPAGACEYRDWRHCECWRWGGLQEGSWELGDECMAERVLKLKCTQKLERMYWFWWLVVLSRIVKEVFQLTWDSSGHRVHCMNHVCCRMELVLGLGCTVWTKGFLCCFCERGGNMRQLSCTAMRV